MTRIKLLRTIRLDPSDSFVFVAPADPGEWAVPGGFMFDGDPANYAGRDRQAFRAGFLGLATFGWSTLAVVVEATADEYAAAVEALTRHLLERHGAPSAEVARAAAEEEIAYASSLADHPVQTLVALHRSITPVGDVSEQFRTLSKARARDEAKMPCSAGAFAVVADESEAPEDTGVDIGALARAAREGGMP